MGANYLSQKEQAPTWPPLSQHLMQVCNYYITDWGLQFKPLMVGGVGV